MSEIQIKNKLEYKKNKLEYMNKYDNPSCQKFR